MLLETLYKRSKTSAIQYYKVEVCEASMDKSGWNIIKESGQLGTTSPIIHKETITQGKNIGKANETTPQQQAESQAKSDWQKKKDEGYKSLDDLNIGHQNGGIHHGLFTINGVIQVPAKSLEEVLNEVLPLYNTDASGNVKPMLAKDYTKVKKIEFPVFVQPKLDGVRCLMICSIDSSKGGTSSIQFLSRSGKNYDAVTHLATQGNFPDGKYILDGELYSDELNFQEIVSAVKALKSSTVQIMFRAYDMVSDATQSQRLLELNDIVNTIQSPYIKMVGTDSVTSIDAVKTYHDKWVQEGYEGAMIRIPSGKYGQGQRSSDLLKVKEFDETEFRHVAWEFGQREEDLIAVCHTKSGIEFRAKMQGTREQKRKLLNDYPEYNSTRKLTVKHFGYTDNTDIPRFPVGKVIRDFD